MRVMQVITSLGIGGAERQLATLAEALVADGHAVEIVTLAGPNPLADSLRQVGCVVTELGGTIGRPDPRLITRLRRLVRDQRPDIVHSHIAEANIVSRLALIGSGVPLIDTVHNLVEGGRDVSIAYRATRRLPALTTFVSVTSQRRYESKGLVVGDRTIHVPNAVDPRFASLSTPRRHPVRRFIFVGRLVAPKRVHDLLESFALVGHTRSDLTLDIVGDGPERAGLERRASALDVPIRFHGAQGDVGPFLAEADAFVTASSLEGHPVSLLEAAAAGLVIGSTEFDALADTLVLPPRFRAPVGKPECLSRVIAALADLSLNEQESLSIDLRAQVTESSSIEQLVLRWAELYKRAVNKAGTR